MDASPLIQLGIGGAALYVLYKLARLALTIYSKNDAAKTQAIGDGFRAITDSHAQMVRDNALGYHQTTQMLHDHHAKVAGQIGNVRDLAIAIDSKLSTALDLTPIRQQRPDLVQPIDKTLVLPDYGAQPPSGLSDNEVTPPMGPPPQPPQQAQPAAPPRAYNRPPTPVPLPPAERPHTPTSRAQSVPRPVGGEYSGAVKKPQR